MQAHPERPEDRQTQSPNSTYKECRPPIHTLENEGDVYHHQAVEKLFAEEKDPITIIKMKEIYEKLERMIDKAEDVANVLEAIVLKNA